MKKILLLLFLLCNGFASSQAQSIKLPSECQKILKTKFRSWKMANVPDEIKDYYKRERAFELANLIKGDWNGDGKTDYAILLDNKANVERRIILVLMKAKRSYKSYFLDGSDCIMSAKKGQKDYSFDTGKNFRYKNDAIFNYIWEKAGVTYVWEKGKFGIITTSD